MIFKTYKSVLATTRQQMLRLFSALYTHKNISLYRQCLSKENAVLIQTSVLYLPLYCEEVDTCRQTARHF